MFCPWPLSRSTLCSGRDPPCRNFPMACLENLKRSWCGLGVQRLWKTEQSTISPVTAWWGGNANTRYVLLITLDKQQAVSQQLCFGICFRTTLFRIVSKANPIILQEAREWGQGYFSKYLCCVVNSSGYLWYYYFRKHLHAFLISLLI